MVHDIYNLLALLMKLKINERKHTTKNSLNKNQFQRQK